MCQATFRPRCWLNPSGTYVSTWIPRHEHEPLYLFLLVPPLHTTLLRGTYHVFPTSHFHRAIGKAQISLLMFKRRSAHGIFSSPQPPIISSPSNFVKLSGMDQRGLVAANSVVADVNDNIDGGAEGEPLVHDIFQVESSPEPISQETSQMPVNRLDFQPLGSHPVASSSEEEDIAPPPPDFTRRGIHIPTRTRFVYECHLPSQLILTPIPAVRLPANVVVSFALQAPLHIQCLKHLNSQLD